MDCCKKARCRYKKEERWTHVDESRWHDDKRVACYVGELTYSNKHNVKLVNIENEPPNSCKYKFEHMIMEQNEIA